MTHKHQERLFTPWLLSMFDAGLEIKTIEQRADRGNVDIEMLQIALDDASGPNPQNLVINGPKGHPGRLSWVDDHGQLQHRPSGLSHHPAREGHRNRNHPLRKPANLNRIRLSGEIRDRPRRAAIGVRRDPRRVARDR
jgi:hypothetical protein